ncbi:MAG: STAS domain-containing protein [Acidobacteriota bacterium]
MDLDIRQTGAICALRIKGPFKSSNTSEFDSALDQAIAGQCLYLILDLEQMNYIDSSGIGAIVGALRRTRQVGGDTKLVNPSAFATKTFKMVGILNLFTIFPSEDEAVAACRPT